MSHRRARLSLIAAAVAAGVIVPAAGAAGTPGTATAAGTTVTLVTGDKVTIGGRNGIRVRAAKGREHIGFRAHTDGHGDTHVIPEDAITLLSKGKLDPRLFDVTELARAGYDDASRSTLPLIVDFPGKTPSVAGAQVSRELPAMSAAAVSVERSVDFWATARNAEHVWLDGPVRASLDESVPRIGVPEAWAAGHTGAGATVAVLDTGIDATHPDLSDAIVGARNFSNSDSDDDRYGHGTHVASIVTGNGAASGGRYRGVAPDAKLLNGKVMNDVGIGLESWILAGMEWAVASGADVVNLSVGTPWSTDGTDPLAQAVNQLTAKTGVLFVVAAGNSGGEVGSPGSADAALTVGSVDRNDQLADDSSRGRQGGGIKPDITAPGVDIVAAKAADGVIGTPAGDGYVSLSGTSMATPHVAGAAAILAAQHPDWQAEQLKATLMGTAKPNDGLTVFEQGAGRVDVAEADTSTVFASPASVDVGTQQWPHGDDQPVAKTLTYTNTGTEAVTLDLAAAVKGPDGSTAPQGMFTLTPARLTVPAGGQASATLTTDTKVEAADGVYGGVVTASGGGQSVRTPVAVTREVESYDVALTFIDRDGAMTDRYSYGFLNVDNRGSYNPYDPSGTVVARLPKGEYYFQATVMTVRSEDDYVSVDVAEPSFVVDGPESMVVDSRKAKPLGFTVDEPNARAGTALFRFALTTNWGEQRFTLFLPNFDGALVLPSTTTKKDRFTFTAEARMAEWNGSSFAGSPYLYSLRHDENGAVPQTLRWTYRDKQLAHVRGEHAVSTPGLTGFREGFLPVALSSTLDEYYTPDVPWDGQFTEAPSYEEDPVSGSYQADPRTYKAGRTTTVRWNVGVYGPALPTTTDPTVPIQFALRLGDEMFVNIPLATDQGRGRMGYSYGPGAITLLREGEIVREDSYLGGSLFKVGPEQAEYAVRTVASRPAARLSTEIGAEWTFRSAHVDGSVPAALPLLAVRFAPDLDDHNATQAGKRFSIPVFVERNGSREVGQVNTPTVEVSYDDGTTWQAASVHGHHGQWKATVTHPKGAEFVSLRANVSDAAGNAQKVTIIRAYALK
jgi:subtilisin family serine protease